MIVGKSLYDENASAAVVIEKRICIEPRTVTEGFLITVLTYFIYGLEYPTEINKSLECIQRWVKHLSRFIDILFPLTMKNVYCDAIFSIILFLFSDYCWI